MSRGQNGGSHLKDLAVVPGSGNEKPVTRGVPPAFNGTIVSACESVGISLERVIEMMRWAKESEPRVAQFLDTWDALDPSERQAKGTVEVIRQRVGLKLLELLGIVADATYRAAMYQAQIIASVNLPSVVQKLVDRALDDSEKTRMQSAELLSKATGFLPTPKGSQTIIGVTMQDAQATAQSVAAPRPEQTIRSLSERLNEARGLPRAAVTALPERASGQTFPDTIPEEEEGDGE